MTCINVSTKHLNPKLDVKIDITAYLLVHANNLTNHLSVNVSKHTNNLNIECRVICSNKQFTHLIVQPNNVWLDNSIFSSTSFDIYSNVVWKID